MGLALLQRTQHWGLPGTERTARRTEVAVWRFGRAATPCARRASYSSRRTHWRFESGASWARRPFFVDCHPIAPQVRCKLVQSLCKHIKRGTSLMTAGPSRHIPANELRTIALPVFPSCASVRTPSGVGQPPKPATEARQPSRREVGIARYFASPRYTLVYLRKLSAPRE